jgi:hypothetical protein
VGWSLIGLRARTRPLPWLELINCLRDSAETTSPRVPPLAPRHGQAGIDDREVSEAVKAL